MTGHHPDGDEEEQQHIVVHWDGGGEDEAPYPDAAAIEPEPEPRPPILRRYRYWLYTLGILLVFVGAAYAIGEATYDPPSRVPQLVFSTDEGLYGTNSSVASELDMVRETFSQPAALELEPAGEVFHLPLRRTVADRLFGERDEAITVFSAKSAAGEHRFLVLSGGDGEQVFAIEAPLGLSSREQPNGVFLALDPSDEEMRPLVESLRDILPAVGDLRGTELSPDRYYVFGPYQGGDAAAVRDRIEGNVVMSHLASAIEEAEGGVSAVAPLFIVGSGPSRGTINAIYHPSRRVVMEPLWGASETGSLAHELVHAYMDTVVSDEDAVFNEAADYLERAHPVLHGEVVGDLYERLGREGRAEETLAFITGAIAAQQTKTVAAQRLLENRGNLQISEAIFYSDIDLLVRYGLLPPCMLPNEGTRGEVTPSYYEIVEETCA